ncbi:MAG TPA: class I SAM-dependent methyltransferase, partial [Gemmataceae bacterium]|nr:class I SAM-dependent methyltransferase [Gemmataceae bacterium]
MSITEMMRRDWDDRARKEAFHYIATWRQDWDPDSFFRSGEEDYQRLVEVFFRRWQWQPGGKAMLELGCGAGRMTRSFARRFACVYACDISPEMLRRAKTLLPAADNIVWLQGDGKSLAGVRANSVDFVFSYIVLQHMPTEALAFQYVREMLRVLKPEGAFLVHC